MTSYLQTWTIMQLILINILIKKKIFLCHNFFFILLIHSFPNQITLMYM